MTIIKKCLGLFSITVGLSSMAALSAHAQEATGSVLEEIVVTAQYREENLQDVPIAVTAFSADMIRDADLYGLEDIATRVPSLTFSPFAPGQSIIALRGVSSNDDGAGTDNSVAVFLDEVYIGGLAAVAFDIFDVETIEVLRGPQGTLFGKNAIGGVINIRSKRPDTERVTGRVELTAGNFEQFGARGFVSGPLSDNWAGKLTVSSRQNEGYVDNIFLNKKQKDENLQSFRGQLLYHDDTFEGLFSVEITSDDTEDMGRIPVTGISAAFDAMGGDRDHTLGPYDGDSNRESTQISLKLSKQFDSGELISITGWRDFESKWNMDSVGVPFAAGPTPDVAINDNINEQVDAVSQEFRWVSNLDGSMNFVAGLFFLSEDTHRIETFTMGGTADGDFTSSIIGIDVSNQNNETTSYAAYGQLTWDATERVRVNVGARFTAEEKKMDNISIDGGFPGIITQDLTASISDDWTNFSPKLSVDYQFTDSILGYASIAQGFKSGGFPAAPSRIQDFKTIEPEEATSYEIGVKADLFENRLRVNVTGYFMDYTDLQVQRFGVDPGAPAGSFGAFQTLNAGDAEVSGLELETTWLITDNLSFVGSYSLTDSEFVDTVLLDTQGNPVDISGQELTRAADSKYAIALEYYQPLSRGALKFRLDQRYTSTNRQDVFSDEPVQPGFHVMDARASWISGNEGWEVALWSKNLRDEEYISHVYIVGPGVIATFGDPLTYGVTVTKNF
jgi:iron complex outermembrane receptor protein